MTRKTRIWLAAAAIFVAFLLIGWFLGPVLKLKGTDLWVFRVGLWVLGLVAGVVVLWFFLRDTTPAPGAVRADDVDALVAGARAQLAASRVAGKKSAIPRLPLVLVLGSEGSAKTTTIVRSGLDPELLAGGVSGGESIAPTRGVNVWYSGGTIFLEAGGPLAGDATRFAKVIRHLHPRRVGAVLGKGEQPPRMALVCVSCEELLRAGASESALAMARTLRARLGEVSRALGIRLPVYVVFTKADRIPYFADYVQNFSNDEAREVLGVTLPADAGAAGVYADRQGKRVTDAFQALFRSLADRRLLYLARENAPDRKPGEYEFPRELRKLAPLATQFLVELGKPSELQVSPFLRGFYFAGVRAVIVTESAPAMAPQAPAARAAAGMAATGVFHAGQYAAAAQAPSPAASTARKVPQWVFLSRLFTDVVLGDHAAMAVTKGGARVNLLRRVALGAAVLAAVVVGAGFTTSYLGNRQLEGDTMNAARAMAAVSATGREVPPVDALQKLDSLRAQLQLLGGYEREGAPLHLRWGLYSGSALYPEARRVYFASFDKLLFGATRESMASTLRSLPDAPGSADDYGATYNLLKAYLITTSFPAKSSDEFLTPVLMTSWSAARPTDSLRTALARRQFAFYANELRFADPYALQADVGTVQHARGYLNKFAGAERIYQYMLSEASKSNASVQFNRKFPGSGAYVVDGYEVPGAFTKGGWTFMQGAFKNADRFFQGESWVLGDQAAGQLDKQKVLADLRARYQSDYIKHWRTYLQSAAVVRYSSVKDASKKLSALAGNQSPLLALLSLASQNSAVDTAVSAALQPAAVVTPPAQTDKLVGQSNQAYMTALTSLQSAIDQVANAPVGGADAAVAQTTTNAANAKVEAQKIAQQFRVAGDAAVSNTVLRLLQDPITYAEPLVRNFGAGELNGKGGAFCAQAAPVLAKYPFDPNATAQASPDEVAAIFKPQTGALWTYYGETLQSVLVKQGNDYVAKPGGTTTVSPAFLAFFNRAATVSDALFPEGAAEPRLTFSLKPVLAQGISDLVVTIEGQRMAFSDKKPEAHQFSWTGASTGTAEMSGKIGKTELNVLSFQGPWALFQMFGQADRWQTLGPVHTVEWVVRTGGQPMTLSNGTQVKVAFEVNLGNAPPVLRKGYFSGLRCVSTVANR